MNFFPFSVRGKIQTIIKNPQNTKIPFAAFKRLVRQTFFSYARGLRQLNKLAESVWVDDRFLVERKSLKESSWDKINAFQARRWK